MKYFLFILTSSLFLNVSAQNIRVIVKKGSVQVGQALLSPSDGLSEIKKNSSVRVSPGSLILVKKNSTFKELEANKSYTYEDINHLFTEERGFFDAFISVLLWQDYSIKTQKGGATRGEGEMNPLSFSPDDSLSILSDSIYLQAGEGSNRLLSDIFLIRDATLDTIIRLPKTDFQYLIQTPQPGRYSWKYTLKYNKTYSFKNYFVVPEPDLKQKMLQEYADFKQKISDFSPQMQGTLIKEYLAYKKIYLFP